MSVTCGRSVVFSGYSDYLHQYNWPPWYSWNIVENGAIHHNSNPSNYHIASLFTLIGNIFPVLKCNEVLGDMSVILLILSMLYRDFCLGYGQTKYYKLSKCCISNEHALLKSMNKDCLFGIWTLHQYGMTSLSVDCLFTVSLPYNITTESIGLVQSS